MSLSKRDKNLLMFVFALLIFVLVYVLVFNKLNEKTTQLEAENRTLQTMIDKLNELYEEREFYQQETVRFKQESTEIKNKYPAEIYNADKVLYVKSIEERYDWYINYLGIGQVETVEATYPEAEQISVDDQLAGRTTANAPANPNGIYLYRHGINTNFEASYGNVKNALRNIVGDARPKEIHTLSLSFNEDTGKLSGSMDASMYSMTGTDVQYQNLNFNGVKTGTDDIFKSFDRSVSAVEEDTTEETAEDGETTQEE